MTLTKKQKNRLKKSKSNRRQSALSKILSSSQKPSIARNKYFRLQSAGEIRTNISKISSHRFFKEIIDDVIRKDNSQVYVYKISDTELEKSLNWMLGICIHFKDKLTKFSALEHEITFEILNENFDKAVKILDEIDKECGPSSWSITIRGAVFAAKNDTALTQNLFSSIVESCGDNKFYAGMCHYLFNRNQEPSVFLTSSNIFRSQVMRSFSGELLQILMNRVVPFDYSNQFSIDYEELFNWEKHTKLIDIFKSLIKFCRHSLEFTDSQNWQFSRTIIEKLHENINENKEVRGLSNLFGIRTEWEFNKKCLDVIDTYTVGDYQETIKKFNTFRKLNIDFVLFELAAKSIGRVEQPLEEDFQSIILSCLVDILLKNDGYYKSLSFLLSRCHAFQGIPWFEELQLLITKESNFLGREREKHLETLSFSLSDINTPKKLEHLPAGIRSEYMRAMRVEEKNSVSSSIFLSLHNGSEKELFIENESNIDSERLKKYQAIYLFRVEETQRAIQILKTLSVSADPLIRMKGIKDLASAYISAGLYPDAIELMVRSYFSNKNYILLFDTEIICKKIKEDQRSFDISSLIVLSIHSRFNNAKFNTLLRYKFEVFLVSNNFKDPIEVTSLSNRFSEERIDYFLEYIATQDIMKLCMLFNDRSSIENCRLKICSYLIEKNISKSKMVEEAKEITKNQVLRRAGKQVDHSRIFADISAFYDVRSGNIRDLYERFKEICKKDHSLTTDEAWLKRIAKTLKEGGLISKASTIHLLEVPLNEKNSAFLTLIKMFRDEFTFGEKGLNSYLSTRIRHGVLPNKIRKCATDYSLIIPRKSQAQPYRASHYWLEKYAELPGIDLEVASKLLSDFASKFEEKVNEVNDEWLQIFSLDQDISQLKKGGAKENAKFDFSLSVLETYLLQLKLGGNATYDDLCKIAIDWLWERTERNLKLIKGALSTTFKDSMFNLYDSLKSDLMKIHHADKNMAELFDAINRSKGDLGSAIDVIEKWFTRSEANNISHFDMEIALEISEKTTNITTHKNDTCGLIFKGQYLASFVDLFFIVLDNCVTKSNLSRQDLEIYSEIKVDGDILKIEFKNTCFEIESPTSENLSLDVYREAYEKSDFRQLAQQEGGSGFMKIKRIFTNDLQISHKFEFGYVDKTHFLASFSIKDFGRLLYEEHSYSGRST